MTTTHLSTAELRAIAVHQGLERERQRKERNRRAIERVHAASTEARVERILQAVFGR